MHNEHMPTRRAILGAAAGIGFAICLPASGSGAVTSAATDSLKPNAWIHIRPDDTILIYAPASEIGQGSLTALPLLVAEDLDADWSKVQIEMSPVSEALYGNPKLFNLMLTIASYSLVGYFESLRIAGATARLSMVMAAAKIWGVPIQEVSTQPNVLFHSSSGRKMTYGELAGRVTELPVPPEVKKQDLKPAASFRLIGKDVPRRDIPSKVDGSAAYAINTQIPGLLQATIIRSPVLGARVGSFRTTSRLPGGVKVRKLGADSVAIVGPSMSAVLASRDKVEIVWTKTDASNFSDAEAHARYVSAARDSTQVTRVWDEKGNVAAAMGEKQRTVEREYSSDYFYHAQIEPLNAVCRVSADGKSAEVWAGTQAPAYALQAVARALGTTPEKITLHRSYSGGAFGRRGAYDQDYVVDAALLARDLGRPVKVVWSRDEDVRVGRFKPMTAQLLKAAIASDGSISAWKHRVACEDPLVTTDPPRYKAANEMPFIAMMGTNIPSYDIPNQLIEFARQPIVVRVAPMRGVGAPVNRFAVESFIDELATEQAIDPVAFRRKLLKDSPRGLQVLNRAAAMASWGVSALGRAKGIAYSDYGDAFISLVVEISVDQTTGVITAHKMWAALDAGLIVQPDTTKASIEGGLIFGLSMAIKERITFKDGRAEQTNFFDYPILRMAEAPEIEVELIPSSDPPAGIAESSPIVVPAAIANAFATLTGRRIRQIPLHPARVSQAMA